MSLYIYMNVYAEVYMAVGQSIAFFANATFAEINEEISMSCVK